MGSSIHADTAQTLRISSRRFEPSPFESRYVDENVIFGVYAGRFYPIDLGEDAVAAYWKLRREAVLYDVPERPVQIEGPDAVPFLEHVLSRRIGNMKEGRGRYAIACTHTGGIFMDGVLFRLSRDRFWYVQPDGALEAWLVAHSSGYKVTISDPKSRVLQIQGPASAKIIHDASAGTVGPEMKYFHSGLFPVGGQEVYVSRTGWTGELGYEIYSLGDHTDHGKLFDDVMAAGRPHGMIFASIRSMEMRRIEAGILDNLTDFDQSMTPFAAGLGPFVDLDKEGFVGREALLQAERDVRLFGLKSAHAVPDFRAALFYGDERIGHVSAATWSPSLDCAVGYARFDKAGDWLGRSVRVQGPDGALFQAEVVDLPFLDKEKKIPRRETNMVGSERPLSAAVAGS